MAKERKRSDKRVAERAKPKRPGKGAATPRPAHGSSADGPGGFVTDDRPGVVVTVDVVLLAVHDGELAVLLVERRRGPDSGAWALPGTVVGLDETLGAAAVRAVSARTGVAAPLGRLDQFATFADLDRDPRTRVVSVAFVAVASEAVPPAGGPVASGRWWAVKELHKKKGPAMAFDHRDILATGVERVRSRIEHTDLATALVDEPFTLGELRRAYEAVWGTTLGPANFRRKVLATRGFVEPTGATRMVGTGRPADLYRRGADAVLHPPMLRPASSR